MNIRRRILNALARAAARHPVWMLLGAVLVAVVSLLLAANNLEIETSRSALISEDRPYNRRYNEYRDAFEKWDDLIVAVRAPEERTAERFVDEVGTALDADDEHVRRVLYRIDSDALEAKGLLFLSKEELKSLRSDLEDNREMLVSLAEEPGLNPLFSAINQEMAEAMVGELMGGLFGEVEGEEEAEEEVDLTLLQSLTGALVRALEGEAYTASPWKDFFETPKEQRYLTSEEGDLYFVFVEPVKRRGDPGFAADVLRSVRAEVNAAVARHPGVEAGVTGMAALSVDEMLTSRSDTALATLIAVAGVFVMFLLFFRQVVRPMFAIFALLVAISWTLGFTTIAIGRLTVLSVAFTAILIGLGIDFGIHVLLRYEEEWRGDQSTESNLGRTLARVGPAVVAGALTTSLAFFAVVLTDFRGLAEIGIIAGAGVLLALVSSVTVLPALLALAEKRRGGRIPRPPSSGGAVAHLVQKLDRRPKLVLLGYALLTVVFGLFASKVRLDRNLLELQAEGTESVYWERRIMDVSGRSTWYAVSMTSSLEEVARRTRAFEALSAVDEVESIASVIPEDQAEKMAFLDTLKPLLADIPITARPAEGVEVDALVETLKSMRFKLSETALAKWAPEKLPEREQIVRARRTLTAAIDQLQALSPRVRQERLSVFQARLFDSFYADVAFLKNHLDPGFLELADLPESIRTRYIGTGGQYLIKVFARENIWQHDEMERFLTQVRQVDPEVTGSPVQTYEAGREMSRGYAEGGLYALVVILLYLLFELRSLRLVGLAVLPLIGGGIWTLGWMGLFGLDLNLANLVLLPLLIGIGVDSGIHLVTRYGEGRERGFGLIATKTGLAVIASALTTAVGFASLLVARHHGIWSIGAVLSIGITCVLIAAIVALPALARRFRRRSDKPSIHGQAHPPRTAQREREA